MRKNSGRKQKGPTRPPPVSFDSDGPKITKRELEDATFAVHWIADNLDCHTLDVLDNWGYLDPRDYTKLALHMRDHGLTDGSSEDDEEVAMYEVIDEEEDDE